VGLNLSSLNRTCPLKKPMLATATTTARTTFFLLFMFGTILDFALVGFAELRSATPLPSFSWAATSVLERLWKAADPRL
jgi:hypothetical protein